MMDVYTYCTALPDGVHEMVTPCFGGYTVYVDERLCYEARVKAYNHALHHIECGDFEKTDVQCIECDAHKIHCITKETL